MSVARLSNADPQELAGRAILETDDLAALPGADRFRAATDRPLPTAERTLQGEPPLQGLIRALNVGVAVGSLVLLAPLFAVIAAAVRLTSRGPVLYSQTRIGLDRRRGASAAVDGRRTTDLGGRVFVIYKFRTMTTDAEVETGAVWAQENDPRVTRVGRYLRALRLDELPQLWNVVRGDMNIVGPRPERPDIVQRLRLEIPEYTLRHRVLPGITGLAQVNQNYDTSLDDVRAKVRWDLEYIRTRSLAVDLKIMALTAPAILFKFRGR